MHRWYDPRPPDQVMVASTVHPLLLLLGAEQEPAAAPLPSSSSSSSGSSSTVPATSAALGSRKPTLMNSLAARYGISTAEQAPAAPSPPKRHKPQKTARIANPFGK